MRLKTFFAVTAVVEIVTGVGLLVLPAVVVAALLGIHPAATETLLVGRIAGAALLAIGVTCALVRVDAGPTGRAVLAGVLIYDVLAALLLVYAAISLQMAGPALWPAVVLHTLLAVWGLVYLRQLTVS